MIELNKVYQTLGGGAVVRNSKNSLMHITKLKNGRAWYTLFKYNGVSYGTGARDVEQVEKWIVHEITKETWEETRFGPWPARR